MTTDLLNLAQGLDTTELDNMTETHERASRSRGLLPTGTAFVRFCTYIEFGLQPQEFKGQKKTPQQTMRLGFKVVGGVGVNEQGDEENFVAEDGFLPTIATPFDIQRNQIVGSKSVAIFNALNVAPKTATHFTQKLGQLYMLPIGVTTKGDKKYQEYDFTQLQPAIDPTYRRPIKEYADKDGNLVPIPELKPEDIQLFLWNKPSGISMEHYQAMWDSIHIEGTWDEKKDANGKVTAPARSKNFLQEKCLGALDFNGSSLQLLLGGVEYPSLTAEDTPAPAEIPDVPEVPEIPEL